MTAETKPYPVTLKGELIGLPSRGLWLVKWFLAMPHYFCFIGLGAAYIVVSIIAFFAIVFTGKYPKSLFDFNLGVMRWAWRVYFYAFALGTDKYPPFSLDSMPDYPADLDIVYPEKLSRGLVWVKFWLLAFPHYVVVAFFQGGYGIKFGLSSALAFFGGICLLFAHKYPAEIFKLVIGANRWATRVAAYGLMTDEYPPFRLWDS
jgi:hypothetical protein